MCVRGARLRDGCERPVWFDFVLCVHARVTLRGREWEGCIMENDCFQQICRREDSSLHRVKGEKIQWCITGNRNSHPPVTILKHHMTCYDCQVKPSQELKPHNDIR